MGGQGLRCLVTRVSHAAAARELAERDAAMAGLVAWAGLPKLRPPNELAFAALARAITYQQLAGAAAATIHGRMVAVLDGVVTPEAVLAADPVAMRAAGLSGNKLASIVDLAAKVFDGTVVVEPRRLARLSDDDIVARLTAVRGIGRWTAEMFLLFDLRRLDVWPTGDLGVRNGYGLAYRTAPPTAAELELLGDAFRPYRSVAAWYCWRAVDRERGAR
jgi:DNA-3-methyladenine glycosylase II